MKYVLAILSCSGLLFVCAIIGAELGRKFIKKMFVPKEVKAFLGILEELEVKSEVSEAYQLIRKHIEDQIYRDLEQFKNSINKEKSPREFVFICIANISGDFVESGKYHMYRGVLNPQGIGGDLLALNDFSLDELVKMGSIPQEWAEEQKTAIRKNIGSVG